MPVPPHLRKRRPKSPLAGQVLGVRVRRDNQPAPEPKLTPHRIRLLEAISRREIKRGHGSFAGHWRWTGLTVTKSVQPLVACGWASEVGAHLELSQAGVQALGKADGGGTR